ncbi:von Willebrand factor-like [Contarinia nasturtii]|uniref:von Willebrand factor-like n=1 Tax=Contarinia nasturtii TaxID=265458 RepID=UPI0012D47A8D|nr:von Willebrand factor-like [Contarinia nasturtii]
MKWKSVELTNNQLSMDVPVAYASRTSGLYGTYDGYPSNDLKTPDGKIVSDAVEFGHSWSVAPSPPSSYEKPIDDMCALYPERKPEAEEICSFLKSEIFSNCTVNVEGYYEACLFELCAVDKEEQIENSKKTAYSIYADECHVFLPENEKCSTGQVYEACSKSYYRSCGDLLSSYVQESCVAGCRCPEGQIVDLDEQCISVDECKSKACSYKNVTYHRGSKVQQDCNTCECHNGQRNCSNNLCSPNASPPDIQVNGYSRTTAFSISYQDT